MERNKDPLKKYLPERLMEQLEAKARDAISDEFTNMEILRDKQNENKEDYAKYTRVDIDDGNFSTYMTFTATTYQKSIVGDIHAPNIEMSGKERGLVKAYIDGYGEYIRVLPSDILNDINLTQVFAKKVKVPILTGIAKALLAGSPEMVGIILAKWLKKYDLSDEIKELYAIPGNKALEWFQNADGQVLDIVEEDDTFYELSMSNIANVSLWLSQRLVDNPDALYNDNEWPKFEYNFLDHYSPEEVFGPDKFIDVDSATVTYEGEEVIENYMNSLSNIEFFRRLER
jgi:hypothetical protein